MAKITKRPNGRYSITIYIKTENGKKIYKTVYGHSRREVQEKADALRVKLGKGIDVTAEKDSFEMWSGRWLLLKETETSKAQTDLCRARLGYINEFIGNQRLGDITVADIQSCINELAACNPRTGKPSAKNTLKAYREIINQVFEYAIQCRAVDYNPAQYTKLPQSAPQTFRRALTEEEREWVYTTEHRAQTAAMLMLLAGLRRGEVAALTWSDVDLNSGTISVNKAVTYKGGEGIAVKTPKTAAGTRIVPIPRRLVDYLKSLPREHLLVVTSASGTQMTESAWKRMWESYISTLNEKHGMSQGAKSRFQPQGIPLTIDTFTPHCLRHTYCTILYEAGVDVVVAKSLMGHSDIKTTLAIYTHLSEQHKAHSINKLDAFLSGESATKASDSSAAN